MTNQAKHHNKKNFANSPCNAFLVSRVLEYNVKKLYRN